MSKRNFTDVIKLRILIWEIILSHAGGTTVIITVLIRGVRGKRSQSQKRRGCDDGSWEESDVLYRWREVTPRC